MRLIFSLPFAAILTAGFYLALGYALRDRPVELVTPRQNIRLTVTPQIDSQGRVRPRNLVEPGNEPIYLPEIVYEPIVYDF